MAAMKDVVIANVNEIADGEMKPIDVEGLQLLLLRSGDDLHVIGRTCTHYGADLSQGVFADNCVVCPWHKSAFQITNGRVLTPPALDDLPVFEVRVEGTDVIVKVPTGGEEERVRPTPPLTSTQADDRTFAIVGAGAVGAVAAENLRREGFAGRVVLIGQEARLPYDRTKLSKPFLAGQQGLDDLPLRDEAFYDAMRIARVVGDVATVNPETGEVTFGDGREGIRPDRVLVATGGEPNKLNAPGGGLENVFTLRSVADAERIIAQANEGARVVILGSGFIGMEAAASLTSRKCDVTILARSEVPFASRFGKDVGAMFRRLHEGKGVKYLVGEAAELTGDGAVSAVVTKDGHRIPADFVLVAFGVTPRTEMLQGVEFAEDKGVVVDEFLRASERVYVGGDIASVPTASGARRRVEHWRWAEQHGVIAARNMLGQRESAEVTPFFWTNQFGMRLDVIGSPSGHAEIVFDGDPTAEKPSFIAYYLDGDTFLGAVAVKRDAEMASLIHLMDHDAAPTAEEIRSRAGKLDLAMAFGA